jgi:carboxymethylenebutenolidase
MRAGEDPANTAQGNKTAREQGFERLVKLLHEMKSAPKASVSVAQPATTAGKTGAAGVMCHSASTAATGASM